MKPKKLFLGVVTDIVDGQIHSEVTIYVQEAWKGVRTKTIQIYIGHNEGDCGLPQQNRGSYLFHATDRSDEKDHSFLVTHMLWKNC